MEMVFQTPVAVSAKSDSVIARMFPSLFNFGVAAINFSDVVVRRSHVTDSCVIISARKPMEWLLEHCAHRGLPVSWIDSVSIRWNSDGSISVIEK
jgi:hypothetical protein